MRKIIILAAACTALLCGSASAQDSKVDPLHVDVLMKFGFSQAPKEWGGRTDQDETMKVCSATRNLPSSAEADAIMAREKAKIKYPDDGKLMGDWKKGESFAQSGYGQRFTDYPPRNANGGNCYACHQMTTADVSY